MGLDTGNITLWHSRGLGDPKELHIEGKQMSGHINIYLGTAEGLVPDFSLTPDNARKMADRLHRAANYVEYGA